ncbi:dystroglycan 1-like [Haliotis rubra]|uniref:dystroglycan 1-like n=1 Tax=Haliotis rubra TaxID=36100 RepID=UPI001EE54A9B|nr:dystroglycan 1-like [Haliotis rubra]XP_046570475.1 dystroglycan 1-like [Haliotis rubra]XP_046570476.1 dystroglycan 1-like [Haliotis rubra]XP_046570477.1 dystroglycan 1-like [Haliotis rubra]XP_046570478.1 dystroglycan 1-like [Haliotis rubra]XP_046570479.1 dystroglycan 1-like [Haliotis rubra]XP_046570480.1 dystroglycan 1-like [Haliotis rubra]XP_046570481.1 dystroglycan 1-like [Haliotis rubra]XP_046570482.1 dystroglycan 1-like [Haliotis rubra]XP_046570483.1 dystroglycan 1-like [Haliotis ru
MTKHRCECRSIAVKYMCGSAAVSKMAVVFVLVSLMLASVGHCSISVVDSNDIWGISSHGSRTGDDSSVSLMWGVADTTASVGHFFNYTIPQDAFKGNGLQYKVMEAGKDSLPRWLVFSPKKQLLKGLPTSSDLGQYNIEVVAVGLNGEQAKDIFSIFVNEDTGPAAGSTLRFKEGGPKTVRCKRSEPETAVSIVVDVDVDNLGAQERLAILTKLVSHLNLAEDMVKLSQVGQKPLTDASALVSGAGDAKTLQTPGSFVSWLVGCGRVQQDHMQALQQVETDSSNGVMADAIGYPIHVWHVTNSRFQEHKRRKRQAIRATATPAVTPTLPIRGPTDTIRATGTEQDAMTRPVPTLDSPSFGIQPTKTMAPMEKTASPVMPTKVPGGMKPSVVMPEEKPMTKTQVLPTKTYVMTDVMPSKSVPMPTDAPTRKPESGACRDLVPVVKEPMKNMMYSVGEVIRYKIPENTFYDCRVGNTRKLRLLLMANTTTALPSDYWIKFDMKKQLIQGLPLEGNIGKHLFNLIGYNADQADTVAKTAFNITIIPDPRSASGQLNHEVSMTLDYDFEKFSSSTENKISFLNKVAKLNGERNAKNFKMNSVTKGSTVVSWTNTDLASPDCPVDQIKAMMSKFVQEDGSLNKEAIRGMKPFNLKGVGVVPLGACENDPNFPVLPGTKDDTDDPSSPDGTDTTDDTSVDENPPVTPEPEPTTTEGVRAGSAGGAQSDDIWITTVVPAVVIVAILLLALLIACILYRKKRKGKMNLEDQNTFVNKGVPVIFQDELDEKPTDSSKPLLMEGQPPCPPPEYQRGDSQGSTPPVNHKQPQFDHDDHIEDTNVTSPLYQPPPPVTASSGNKQPRPHVPQPAYRSQPPSIPP